MRNLKKILALVLALVMSLSLMATAGAADFADASSISDRYETAVNVLEGLKVFKGYAEDNTFRPQGDITRAEVATIIYRIATGDVDDAQASIYTNMTTSFSDLNQAEWARGYVNYSHNAQIIKGEGGGKFNPNGKISGYATLAMILRTMGYGRNGEFEGAQWEIMTAAKAKEIGLIDNVMEAQLGSNASREMVAEILFRGLLADAVTYNAITGYVPTGKTLGQNVGLSEVTGVITANEYAALYDDATLADGKTELTVGTKVYTLDTSTTLDDIGEARHAYLRNGKTVLAMDGKDELNVTAETPHKANNLNGLLKDSGLTVGAGDLKPERYVNFDFAGKWTTDYRIRYVLKYSTDGVVRGTTNTNFADAVRAIKAANPDATVNVTMAVNATPDDPAKDGSISVLIKPKGDVSQTDITWLKHIFANGDLPAGDDPDYEVGEIYINTQSTKDISDDPDYSYELFRDKFLKYTENAETVGSNENDNWLKIIDCDKDGYVDYIFKVVYTMTDVVRVRNDVVTLGTEDDVMTDRDAYNNITADNEIVCADELAVGDIVYYALIDGDIQATKVEPVTVTIDKKNLNKKTVTTTDGVDYDNSGVSERIEDLAYVSDVLGMTGKITYDLYLGLGGHVVAYKESVAGDYTLITNAWFMAQRGGYEYAVMTYNDESDSLEDADVTSGGGRFIDNGGDNNRWDQMYYFGTKGALNAEGYFADPKTPNSVMTTVASLRDGALTPVDELGTSRTHVMIDVDKDDDDAFVIPRSARTTGRIYTSATAWAYSVAGSNVELRATNETVYYYVYPDGTDGRDGKDVVVKRYVGYANAPDIVKGKDEIEDVYAVGTVARRASDLLPDGYYTADVVVVEFSSPYVSAGEAVFVYDSYLWNNSVRQYNVDLINSAGEVEEEVAVTAQADMVGVKDGDKRLQPGAYWKYPTSVEGLYLIERMTPAEAAKNFQIGQITTSRAIDYRDYADVACLYDDGTVASYKQPKLADTSVYYQLDYALVSNKNYHEAYLDPDVDELDVLPEGVERVRSGSDYDKDEGYREFTKPDHDASYDYYWNDVLIYAPKGTIVYAISFQNFGDDYDVNYKDYAQTIWESMLPAAPVPDTLNIDLGLAGGTGKLYYGKKEITPDASGLYKVDVYGDPENIILTVELTGVDLGAPFRVAGDWVVISKEKKISSVGGVNTWEVKLSCPKNVTKSMETLPIEGTHVALWTVDAVAAFVEEISDDGFDVTKLSEAELLLYAATVNGIIDGQTTELARATTEKGDKLVDALKEAKKAADEAAAVVETEKAVDAAADAFENLPDDATDEEVAAAKEEMYKAALDYAEALGEAPTDNDAYNTAVETATKDVKDFADTVDKVDTWSPDTVAELAEAIPSKSAMTLASEESKKVEDTVAYIEGAKAACEAADKLIAESTKDPVDLEALTKAAEEFTKANKIEEGKTYIGKEDQDHTWDEKFLKKIEKAADVLEEETAKANAKDAEIKSITLTDEAKKTMELTDELPDITLTYTDDTKAEALEKLTAEALLELLTTEITGAEKDAKAITKEMIEEDKENTDPNSKVFKVTVPAADKKYGKSDGTATITVKVLTDAEKLGKDVDEAKQLLAKGVAAEVENAEPGNVEEAVIKAIYEKLSMAPETTEDDEDKPVVTALTYNSQVDEKSIKVTPPETVEIDAAKTNKFEVTFTLTLGEESEDVTTTATVVLTLKK